MKIQYKKGKLFYTEVNGEQEEYIHRHISIMVQRALSLVSTAISEQMDISERSKYYHEWGAGDLGVLIEQGDNEAVTTYIENTLVPHYAAGWEALQKGESHGPGCSH